MDIYIKSFNRAYLLHRTIASIYHYLNDFDGRIVVLDDGTPQKYLDKISELFPDVQIVKSPYYEQKSKDILSNKTPEKVIPANFWRDEVLKGTEYFILLEDDMWFNQPINYKDFTKNIYDLKMDMIKFLWLKNSKLISDNIIQKTDYFNIVQPKVLTKNHFLFDAIFRTNKFKLGSLAIKLFNHKLELLKYYHLYMVAGGVFSKRYYDTCWKSSQNNVDELKQISQLLKSKINSFNLGNTKNEILKTTIKFTASDIQKEKFATVLDVFKFNSILNEAWYNNQNTEYINFTDDVSDEWIKNCCVNSDVKFEFWQNWYNDVKKNYELMGCDLD
ncbi:hypothetical protein [Algoriella sp.]|uniref:hypothetical protein n=1 Tax=Algoriella sp. TaxID=1872434 RepID=UPI002FC5D8EC